MILNDIPYRTDFLVKSPATPDTKTFSHRNLHTVHIVPVPQRFEKGVSKPEIQQVLNWLAHKKIFPALYAMFRHGRLRIPIVGVARSGWTNDASKAHVLDAVGGSNDFDQQHWPALLRR